MALTTLPCAAALASDPTPLVKWSCTDFVVDKFTDSAVVGKISYVGNNVTMVCVAISSDNIRWKFKQITDVTFTNVYSDHRVHPKYSPLFNVAQDENTSIFIVPRAGVNDAGQYRCMDSFSPLMRSEYQITILGECFNTFAAASSNYRSKQ